MLIQTTVSATTIHYNQSVVCIIGSYSKLLNLGTVQITNQPTDVVCTVCFISVPM